MATRAASPLFAAGPGPACLSGEPTDLAIGTVAVALAALAADGAPPEWIKIAPRGDFRCRDGRTFALDPDAVIARYAADRTHVPIDVGHGTVKDDATPAIGWVEELQARTDGLYGRSDWLAGGVAVLRARTHRYVSPAFHHDAAGRVTWLHSVALVAAPALSDMPALASAQANQEHPMKGIAAAVGLQESASETAILSALQAGFVKKAVHDEALAQLATATGELKRLKDEAHAGEVSRTIEEALKVRKIAPAQKEHLTKLSATPEGFEGVKAMLGSIAEGTVAGASGLDTREVDKGTAGQKDAVTLAAEATKLAKDRGISFAEAMSIVAHAPAGT